MSDSGAEVDLDLVAGDVESRRFVEHARAQADLINSRYKNTKVGWAACHGLVNETQYNHGEENHE